MDIVQAGICGVFAKRESEVRAVVQRVSSASVTVDGDVVGHIGCGFLVLLGVGTEDSADDAAFLAQKVAGLRVFEDSGGKMNLSLADVDGCVLAVSQFTLFGDCRKGRRPSFVDAARPESAEQLYECFVSELRGQGITVETGRFQTHMDVSLVNDGPVTLLLDSRKLF